MNHKRAQRTQKEEKLLCHNSRIIISLTGIITFVFFCGSTIIKNLK